MVLYVFAKTANQRYKVYVAGEYEVRYKRFTALVIVAVLSDWDRRTNSRSNMKFCRMT